MSPIGDDLLHLGKSVSIGVDVTVLDCRFRVLTFQLQMSEDRMLHSVCSALTHNWRM